MKTLTLTARLWAVVPATLLAVGTAQAQIPAAGSPPGLNSAYLRLFADHPAFTARVETQVLDAAQKETVRMPLDWATRDGNVRLEVNLEQMVSQDTPAGAIASLKQAGMSRVISLVRPDKKITYVLYPGVQTYQSFPQAPAEAEMVAKGLKVEKTALGKETVDGHACVKNKVIVRGYKGPVLEVISWNATDLKDFPIQVEMKEKQSTVRMRYTQVRFERPDAKQFELSTNYGLMK
jgi:hypothetical protein